MLVLVAILVDRSVIMLIECGLKCGKLDFEELTLHLLGLPGYLTATIFMFLFAYGAQIAYMVIIGDTVPLVIEKCFGKSDNIFQNREFVLCFFGTFVVLPLCLLKELSSLSWTSLISITSDIVLVSIVISASPSEAIKQVWELQHSYSMISLNFLFLWTGNIPTSKRDLF